MSPIYEIRKVRDSKIAREEGNDFCNYSSSKFENSYSPQISCFSREKPSHIFGKGNFFLEEISPHFHKTFEFKDSLPNLVLFFFGGTDNNAKDETGKIQKCPGIPDFP